MMKVIDFTFAPESKPLGLFVSLNVVLHTRIYISLNIWGVLD